ncbi:hypothetical protein BSZ35_07595 [Salinibacter sp. 10B]|uniref:hypothetical protein n=1 Tax=Salinibacter sp. 10B TaxID=1923971 RepID=UPI000CF4FA91|nr:hypothetical protein [Salinibacter sp. 10B]PQJ34478.1 hypothetical protein BSZ35_07595 [Salinibacter sp. 10B]
MILLLVHAAATLTMWGVILVVQLVHYPLFRHVGPTSYETYQSEHMRRITWIVAPVMTTELVTAGWLAWQVPSGVPTGLAWTGLGLVLFIWATTGLLQVPLHSRLLHGFDAEAHRRLVHSNWLRTGAWTLRAGLALWMLGHVLP